MRHALDLFAWHGRVSRRAYHLAGVLLFAVKYPIDFAVARAFHQPWNPLMYVSPRVSPLLHVADPMWPALLAVALPFIAAGVSLTVRRLRDMGVSPFWAGLFFAPFVHFAFFAVLAIAPPRPLPPPPSPLSGAPYRESLAPAPLMAEPRRLERLIPRTLVLAYLLGLVLSLSLGLGAYVVAVQVSRTLGTMLFVSLPFGMGFFTAFTCAYARPSLSGWSAVGYGLSTILVSFIVLLTLSFEGMACIVMASPILLALGAIGAATGRACARSSLAQLAPLLLLLIPGLVGVDLVHPRPPQPLAVVSTVLVKAPPAVVWRHVISFPPIDRAPEPIFAIVAMPLEARIDGHDPGATRRCVFTNGTFVEPIRVWDAPRELTFGVQSQPQHLAEYLDITQGQFLLTDNHDGTTTLRGTTWYALKVFPTGYWRWWSERLLHAIHMRVLRHVQRLSEQPATRLGASEPAPMPAWMEAANATCPCTRHAQADVAAHAR